MTAIQQLALLLSCAVAALLILVVVAFLLWATGPIRRMHP